MPWSSRWKVDIPTKTLPSYVFDTPTADLAKTPLLLDPDHADTHWLSHDTFRLWSQRFAAGLRSAGLQPGDRVLLYSGNTLFFPVVFMGVIMAGGVFTGANPGFVARELAYQLTDSGAKFLITAEASLETALQAVDSVGFSRDGVFLFDDGFATFNGKGVGKEGVRHWSHLIAGPEQGRKFAWNQSTSPEDLNQTICLNYSSGECADLARGTMQQYGVAGADVQRNHRCTQGGHDYASKLCVQLRTGHLQWAVTARL